MRVSIQGNDSTPLCQIGAIRRAFAALGHEHHFDPIDPDVAFVFEGNASYTYAELARAGVKKTIFNVLDIPHHLPNVSEIIAQYRAALPLASRVTAISETVAKDVETHCGVKASVIYYPMKEVKHTEVKVHEGLRALLVGRVNDPNKRASFAIQSLVRAGFKESEIGIVGPENPRYGRYFGLVTDAQLSELYNSVDYVMSLSRVEGIGLPPCEAACCGAIPIVAPDLTTFNEFWVNSPLGLHYQMLNSVDAVAGLIKSIDNERGWKEQLKQDFLVYGNTHLRPKFEAIEVAKRIIGVYQTIV
jgi:glycosyltransferase involved in cell wall biosynthesis